MRLYSPESLEVSPPNARLNQIKELWFYPTGLKPSKPEKMCCVVSIKAAIRGSQHSQMLKQLSFTHTQMHRMIILLHISSSTMVASRIVLWLAELDFAQLKCKTQPIKDPSRWTAERRQSQQLHQAACVHVFNHNLCLQHKANLQAFKIHQHSSKKTWALSQKLGCFWILFNLTAGGGWSRSLLGKAKWIEFVAN